MNTTQIIVRDFTLPALIGIYPIEHTKPQNISVDITMTLVDYKIPHDKIEDTVSYEGIVAEIRRLASIHHNLVETLAELLTSFCLKDARVSTVETSIRKIEIYPEGAVGCKIIRNRIAD